MSKSIEIAIQIHPNSYPTASKSFFRSIPELTLLSRVDDDGDDNEDDGGGDNDDDDDSGDDDDDNNNDEDEYQVIAQALRSNPVRRDVWGMPVMMQALRSTPIRRDVQVLSGYQVG